MFRRETSTVRLKLPFEGWSQRMFGGCNSYVRCGGFYILAIGFAGLGANSLAILRHDESMEFESFPIVIKNT